MLVLEVDMTFTEGVWSFLWEKYLQNWFRNKATEYLQMNRTKRVNIPYIPEEYTTNYKADLSLSLHFCRRVLKDVLGNKLNSTCCYSFSRIMNE
jgi:hypothetical protein